MRNVGQACSRKNAAPTGVSALQTRVSAPQTAGATTPPNRLSTRMASCGRMVSGLCGFSSRCDAKRDAPQQNPHRPIANGPQITNLPHNSLDFERKQY